MQSTSSDEADAADDVDQDGLLLAPQSSLHMRDGAKPGRIFGAEYVLRENGVDGKHFMQFVTHKFTLLSNELNSQSISIRLAL